MPGDLIHVSGCPHPFRQERVDSCIPYGKNLEQIVEEGLVHLNVPPALWGYGHAFVGDRYVPREQWAYVVPLPGEMVTYRIVPQGGGGGKNPLAMLLGLVVMAVSIATFQYYAVGAGASMLAGYGITGVGATMVGAVAAAAVSAAGMMLINALVPVKLPSLPTRNGEKESEVYSIAGSRNAVNPFGPIPVLLGRHKMVPPQGGLPYTELWGNDQAIRQLFVLGYGPITLLEDPKIGETPWHRYQEFYLEHQPYAILGGAQPSYYGNDILEKSVSAQLKQSGSWQYRVTDQPCNAISIDIAFPRGLAEFNDKGEKLRRFVKLEAMYRVVGSATWFNLAGSAHYVPETILDLTIDSDEFYVYVDIDGVCRVSTFMVGKGLSALMLSETVGFKLYSGWVSSFGGGDIHITDLRAPSQFTGLDITVLPGSLFGAYRRLRISAGTCNLPRLDFYASQTQPLRRTVAQHVSNTPALFEVAVRRVSADTSSDKIFDESWWAGIRSIQYASAVGFDKYLSVISIAAKGTGQLNGAIDELNAVGITYCLDWDRDAQTWINANTNNPASLFRYVLQHPANTKALPDGKLDLLKLQQWHEFCEDMGFTYNRYHDFQESVFETLQSIAAAGLAAVSRPDGKWSVVYDWYRTHISQHFTSRNSWGFKSTKLITRMPHGWRIRFINEAKGYQSDELIVYDDGYSASNATEFEGLELAGVTNTTQAWRLGRYHAAAVKLRPEEYQFHADMEHIVCTRGDLIRVSYDVPMWGLGQGRVKQVSMTGATCTGIVLDEPVTMITGKQYSARFRLSDGTSRIVDIPEPIEAVETTLLPCSITTQIPAVGDLCMFGERQAESVELVVKAIEPGENLTARIIAVDYSPAIFASFDQPIPDFDSQITLPYRTRIGYPDVPIIDSIVSDETVLGSDGFPRIQVSFLATGTDHVQARIKLSSESAWTDGTKVVAEAGRLYITDVEDEQAYDIEIRATKAEKASEWTATATHTVVGRATKPPSPVAVYMNGSEVYWAMPAFVPKDVVGWEILGAPNSDDVFSKGLNISNGIVSVQSFDASPWAGRIQRVWVVTVDSYGKRSDPVSVAINLGDTPVANVVATESEATDGWLGDVSNGAVSSGQLVAEGSDLMWPELPMWGSTTMWGDSFKQMTYIRYLPVPTEYAGARLSLNVLMDDGVVQSVEYVRSAGLPMWPDVGMWGDRSMWLSLSDDEWLPMPGFIQVTAGDEVCVKVITREDTRAIIDDIEWVFDVEDAELSLDSVSISNTGTRLTLPTGMFRWIKSITFGVEYTGGTAVTARYLDKGIITSGRVTSGPLVQCLDSSGNAVAGTVDVRIQGAKGD